MPTRIKQMADIKNKILSKILKVDPKSLKSSEASKRSQSSSSGMDTRVIANIQNRINNPLFSLTIDDYELMCGNKMITKMISKVLECDEKQLRKFCKYINVFKENINSSPKSIKNKMKPKMTLNKLPNDLKTQIIEKYMSFFPTKYVLRDFIPLEKLNWQWLSSNPNAIDLLREKMNNENKLSQEVLNKVNIKDKIDWQKLSGNPYAIELLEEKITKENEMSKEYLETFRVFNKIDWFYLSKNPNPEAIELLKKNQDKINWRSLSENPNAIELLREKIKADNISPKSTFSHNNIFDDQKINWYMLSKNPNAIELLKANYDKISWGFLSENPNAIELLKANYDKIDWGLLSDNPNPKAIELLRKKFEIEKKTSKYDLDLTKDKDKINWQYLSRNPNAIELLREKIKEEDDIPYDSIYTLNKLSYNQKIDWRLLSSNPNAIELLKVNQYKIDWKWLSRNPNPEAIKLIKKRLKYLQNLSDDEYYDLSESEHLNWENLSQNPAAIELLEEKIKEEEMYEYELEDLKDFQKINWKLLSSNPAIFEAK